jgi:septal ring factor EnvC (AmiA/AmiB activator)
VIGRFSFILFIFCCIAAAPASGQNAHVAKKDPALIDHLQSRLDRIREYAILKKELDETKKRASDAEAELADVKARADMMSGEIERLLALWTELDADRESAKAEISVLRTEIKERDEMLAGVSDWLGKKCEELVETTRGTETKSEKTVTTAEPAMDKEPPKAPPEHGAVTFFHLVDSRYAAYRKLDAEGQAVILDFSRLCSILTENNKD